MSYPPIGTALVSFGISSRTFHAPFLTTLPGFSLDAVLERNGTVAQETYPSIRTYRTMEDLLKDDRIELVVITSPNDTHHPYAKAALEAGKHVYCEWPLGRDLAEAEEMAAAARKAGTHVAIGLQGANSETVREAATRVASGAIGAPTNLRALSATAGWGRIAPPFYAYLQDRRNGATLATIAGGHTLAMVEAMVGPYVEVSARTSILTPEVEIAGTGERVARTCADHMIVTGLHATGCASVVEIVAGEPAMGLRCELRGTQGRLGLAGHHPGGYQCAALHFEGESPAAPAGLPAQAINVARLYAGLERDIRTGSRTVPDFARAVSLARLLDAIDRAADEGRTIRIEP